MNDMILITHIDADDCVIAICDPVMLKDILSTEFECLHRKSHLHLPHQKLVQKTLTLTIHINFDQSRTRRRKIIKKGKEN